MRPVSVSVPIDAPREEAFDFLCDLANRPSFMGRFLSDFRLQRLQSSGIGAAARYRIRERGVWVETVIKDVDRPHLIREEGWGARAGRLPQFTAWELTEVGISGCEVRLVHWTEPSHPVDRMKEHLPGARHFYRRGLGGCLAQLKNLLEESGAAARVRVGGGDRVPGAG
jgi:uncharacterized protein YndB with AHSA1/START domain